MMSHSGGQRRVLVRRAHQAAAFGGHAWLCPSHGPSIRAEWTWLDIRHRPDPAILPRQTRLPIDGLDPAIHRKQNTFCKADGYAGRARLQRSMLLSTRRYTVATSPGREARP